MARQARHGGARFGQARRDVARQAWQGMAERGGTRRGLAIEGPRPMETGGLVTSSPHMEHAQA